jgi:NTP pyrophosphatase (non-canonical NTP hydrolase)
VTKAEFNELTGVVRELAEAQRELAEAQRELAEAQKRTEWSVRDLATQVGVLANSLGGSLED